MLLAALLLFVIFAATVAVYHWAHVVVWWDSWNVKSAKCTKTKKIGDVIGKRRKRRVDYDKKYSNIIFGGTITEVETKVVNDKHRLLVGMIAKHNGDYRTKYGQRTEMIKFDFKDFIINDECNIFESKEDGNDDKDCIFVQKCKNLLIGKKVRYNISRKGVECFGYNVELESKEDKMKSLMRKSGYLVGRVIIASKGKNDENDENDENEEYDKDMRLAIMESLKEENGNGNVNVNECGWIYCQSKNIMYLMDASPFAENSKVFFKAIKYDVNPFVTLMKAKDVNLIQTFTNEEMKESFMYQDDNHCDSRKDYFIGCCKLGNFKNEANSGSRDVLFKSFSQNGKDYDSGTFTQCVLDHIELYCNAYINRALQFEDGSIGSTDNDNDDAIILMYYIGVDKDGTILGIKECDNAWMECINHAMILRYAAWKVNNRNVNNERMIQLLTDAISIRFVSVIDKSKGYLLPNTKVIEICVKKPNFKFVGKDEKAFFCASDNVGFVKNDKDGKIHKIGAFLKRYKRKEEKLNSGSKSGAKGGAKSGANKERQNENDSKLFNQITGALIDLGVCKEKLLNGDYYAFIENALMKAGNNNNDKRLESVIGYLVENNNEMFDKVENEEDLKQSQIKTKDSILEGEIESDTQLDLDSVFGFETNVVTRDNANDKSQESTEYASDMDMSDDDD